MVASTHWLATAAGMAVLESGGNAFDAAAATAFVLHVVEPHLNGPGGEVPVMFASATDPTPTVLCGQGVVPAAATIAHYHDYLGLELVPGTGPLAATVPGAVGGWLALLRDHGTKSLRDVLGYAIGYAEDGHPLLPAVADTIAAMAGYFTEHWPTSARAWLPSGRPPRGGDLFRNPVLAATYRRLLAEAEAAGPDRDAQLEAAHRAWYAGFVAEAIDRFSRQEWLDDSGRRHAGVLTGADLAAWRPSYEPAVALDWRGWTVAKPGAWCQGPVLLAQLALLGSGDLPPAGSADLVHAVVEGAKLAFADREAWYGDSSEVPLADLLSPSYSDARRALIGTTASLLLRPGAPGGRQPRLPRYVTEASRAGASELPADAAGASLGEPAIGSTGTGIWPRSAAGPEDPSAPHETTVAGRPAKPWAQNVLRPQPPQTARPRYRCVWQGALAARSDCRTSGTLWA